MAETNHAHGHGGRAQDTSETPIRVGILTCSDRGSRGERADVSGPTLHNLVVERLGGKVAQYRVVPDDRIQIEEALKEWADQEKLDLVLTTGGTGFSPRDVTPEATRAVVEREAPALTHAMLFESLRITPYAMLTRATAGIRRRTLIVNFPGNPKAVQENFDAVAEVLPHAIDIIRGVDTHAHRAHEGGHQGGHDAHAGHQEQRLADQSTAHDGHASRREGQVEHAGHAGHKEHREPAAAPAATGMARNVGGPTC